MNPEEGDPRRTIRCQGAIVKEDRILLIQHREHNSGRSYWLFPGGGQDEGETEEQCVQREMQEETGLTVRVERLLLDMPMPPGGAYQRHHTYLCTPLSGEARPGYEPEVEAAQSYSIVGVKWVDLRDESSWGEDLCADRFTFAPLEGVQKVLGYV